MKTHTSSVLRLIGAAGALGLAAWALPAPAHAFDVHVNLGGPPPPRVEHYEMRDRPGPDYVWVGGYWGGSPGHYEWIRGHWERPSHRGAVWVAPRWERRGDRYYMVKGYWNDRDHDRRWDRDHDHDHDYDHR